MRKIISTGLVVISLVAVTTVGAVAQTEPEQAIVPAGLNADKVDGKSAVGHGASARKRAGKLVATNKRGQLPSNIVKPAWRLIIGKPAAFRDGQIGWGEVQGKPAGFADEVDDGITGLKVTTFTSSSIPVPLAGGPYALDYSCPSGKLMSGGYHNGYPAEVLVKSSFPLNPTTWRLWAISTSATNRVVFIWLNCMTTEPAGGIAAKLSPSSKNAISTASKGAGRK